MNQQLPITGEQELEVAECRAAGAALARSIPFEGHRTAHGNKRPKLSYVQRIMAHRAGEHALRLVSENLRLIRTAEREVREFLAELRYSPEVRDSSGAECMRTAVIA